MLKGELVSMLNDVENILSDEDLSDQEKIGQLEDMFFEDE